jgi:hypothetical protein
MSLFLEWSSYVMFIGLCVFVSFVTRGDIRFCFIFLVFIREAVVIIRPWTSILRVRKFVQYTGMCEDVALQFFIHSLIR